MRRPPILSATLVLADSMLFAGLAPLLPRLLQVRRRVGVPRTADAALSPSGRASRTKPGGSLIRQPSYPALIPHSATKPIGSRTRHTSRSVCHMGYWSSRADAEAAGIPLWSPHDLRHRRISLLHLQGKPWARIGEFVGQRNLSVTADTYTHVLVDEAELDYAALLSHTAGHLAERRPEENLPPVGD
jgi:integrase